MASRAYSQREELNSADRGSQKGTPGKSGPAVFACISPKPPLGSFTKSNQSLQTEKPSGRYALPEGSRRLLLEPTPSHRLWAAAPGATPELLLELNMGARSGRSKPERSTLLGTGTFYFALTQDRIDYWAVDFHFTSRAETIRVMETGF